MRRSPLLFLPAVAALMVAAALASCGARTGLDIPFKEDAGQLVDATHPRDATVHPHKGRDAAKDQGIDVPLPPPDGHFLDVNQDACSTPAYCNPDDPNYIYKCGERIYQCGSLLEQCEVRCARDAGVVGEGGAGADAGCQAVCINPCDDTLGQNTSNGCDFYPVEMDLTDEAVGVCYAVFVVNQWKTGVPAKLEVKLGDETFTPAQVQGFTRIPSGTGRNINYAPYDPAAGIPQNEIAILFLSRLVPPPPSMIDGGQAIDPKQLANCPPGVVPALVTDGALHGSGIGTAFHISSNVPVVAYQMLPYGGGSARVTGATLLLPTNVWGTNYLAANAYHWPSDIDGDGGYDAAAFGLQRAGPSLVVVAQADETHVTINPVAPIQRGPGLPPTGAGQPVTYTIDHGQYVQLTQYAELSGSAIQSDKPVAVIGGSTLMDVPITNIQRADHGEQMLPPVQSLGSQYIGVRYRSRIPGADESVPWRIIAAVDGTNLTFDPPQTGAPARMHAQEVAEFDAPGPFVVSSQDASHPFYMAQYMTGGSSLGTMDGGYYGDGDPEYVNVISPAQYLPRYTFFTDPTYPETNLVVIRSQDATSHAFPDVSLDCAGKLQGWQPVGTGGLFQYTRIDLSTGNFQGQNGCNNGVHTITGSFPVDAGAATPMFGVTIWGWGNHDTDTQPDNGADETNPNFTRWVSYAYPAGANILKLNDVVLSAQ
jgi:hypothetical protein